MGVAKASHIRYPRKFIYYVKVMSIYNNIKLAEQDHREYYFGGPGVFYADFTVNTTFLNKEY
jgi:hypothetical protein